MSTSGTAPAGWHPDPQDPTGAMRWWDGTRWTDHVHRIDPPAAGYPPSGPYQGGYGGTPPPWGGGGYGGRPPWGGRGRYGATSGRNSASVTAIGVAALYILIAATAHIVFFGILPIIMSVRAVQRREPLAAVAVAAAVIAAVLGFAVFLHR